MRAAASDAARSGVAAAVSAAVEYSPVVAEAAENTAKKAGHSLSELFAGTFAQCYEAEKIEEAVEIETEPVMQSRPNELVPATERIQYTSAAAANERVQYVKH